MRFNKATSVVAMVAALALAGAMPAAARGGGGGGHGGGGHGGGGFGGGGHGFGGGGRGLGGGGLGGGGARAGDVAAGGNFGAGRTGGFAAGRGNRGAGNRGVNVARNGGFRGRGRGFGVGGFGFGYGLDDFGYDGFDGPDFADGGYDYDYGPGVQYSQAPDGYDGRLQTGRSVAVGGDTCSTPVKACTLYNQSYVGRSCSCKVPGGRAHGRVTP